MTNINNADLNLLKSLQVLILERHVGRAAERMHVTQSAMSHTLARLRQQFDDPLFVRTAKGLVPTARTEELTEDLNVILSGVENLLTPEHFEPAKAEGTIRIETHDFIATSFLSEPLRKIQVAAPNIVIDLRTITERSYDKLDSNEADLVIGSDFKAKPNFLQQLLVEEELVCLMDKKHPALPDWTVESLFSFPHVRTSLLQSDDDPVEKYTKAQGIPPRKIGLITENLHLQAPFLKGTAMIAFLPKTLASQVAKTNGLRIQKCPLPLPPLSIKIIWHERNQNSALHQWIRGRISTV